MSKIITLKLNLSKVVEERVYQGKRGRWLDVVLVHTPNSEWADYMVLQDLGEDSRVSGVERPILGNGIIRSKKAA